MNSANRILVTGGAGWHVTVIDDLSAGRRDALPDDVDLVEGDVGDRSLVDALLPRIAPVAVIHLAGSISVPESVRDPLKYYANNTCASHNLIAACLAAGVERFVFSSTAAVYGEPVSLPVGEETPTRPVNPYGTSNLMTEWIPRDAAAASGLRYVTLRYFNVAGADPQGRAGQSTPRATHLIKVACQAALEVRDCIEIFGEDYDTPDGTCIRDYVHVSDLAYAHLAALAHLMDGGDSLTLNCGYGHGFSVREVLRVVQELSGTELKLQTSPRRPGDAARLVSDPTRIRERLGWQPKHDGLAFIVETALAWERRIRSR